MCSFLRNHGERVDQYGPSDRTRVDAPPGPTGAPAERPPEQPDERPAEQPAEQHVEIRFTIDDAERADTIAGTLLAAHVVACAQRIGPIRSRYWWSGALQQSDEWLVLLKTRSELTGRVIETVRAHHPYDTPEILAVPVVAGLSGYLGWIDRVTAEGGRDIGAAPDTEPGPKGGTGPEAGGRPGGTADPSPG